MTKYKFTAERRKACLKNLEKAWKANKKKKKKKRLALDRRKVTISGGPVLKLGT